MNASVIRMVSIPELCGLAGACRLEYVLETSKVIGFTVCPDLAYEATCLRVYIRSGQASFIVGRTLHVSIIFGRRGVAEIGDPVVTSVSVDVVNLTTREFAVMVEPSKPMALPYESEHANSEIALLVYSPHLLADLPPSKLCAELIAARIYAARKNSGFTVVINVIHKLFLSDHNGTLVKAVELMRQPLTRWGSGCIPSRAPRLPSNFVSRQCL